MCACWVSPSRSLLSPNRWRACCGRRPPGSTVTRAARVLLVDDQMLLREMLEERLTPEGFEVLVTGDPRGGDQTGVGPAAGRGGARHRHAGRGYLRRRGSATCRVTEYQSGVSQWVRARRICREGAGRLGLRLPVQVRAARGDPCRDRGDSGRGHLLVPMRTAPHSHRRVASTPCRGARHQIVLAHRAGAGPCAPRRRGSLAATGRPSSRYQYQDGAASPRGVMGNTS